MLAALIAAALFTAETERPTIVVVVGAEGASEYGEQFARWAGRWRQAAEKGGARFVQIGGAEPSDLGSPNPDLKPQTSGGAADRDRLRDFLAAEANDSQARLWIVLIGHGTFDGKEAKFNLRGPDVSDRDLAQWLQPFERPLAIINCASSSGPFMNRLAGAGRVVIAATRSGHEHNFSRFGDHFSASIIDPEADLDKDGQTSLLEAYLAASHRIEEFYKQESRLATEHALLDDNGDGLGTPADWFQGTRATRRAKDGALLDGARAHQWCLVLSEREKSMPAELRAQRDQLELAIEALRDKKATLDEAEYYSQLERLLVNVARLYEQKAVTP